MTNLFTTLHHFCKQIWKQIQITTLERRRQIFLDSKCLKYKYEQILMNKYCFEKLAGEKTMAADKSCWSLAKGIVKFTSYKIKQLTSSTFLSRILAFFQNLLHHFCWNLTHVTRSTMNQNRSEVFSTLSLRDRSSTLIAIALISIIIKKFSVVYTKKRLNSKVTDYNLSTHYQKNCRKSSLMSINSSSFVRWDQIDVYQW